MWFVAAALVLQSCTSAVSNAGPPPDGLVPLEVVIDEQGKVADAKVLDAPSSALADAAVAAVRQWTFEPTEIDGKRVKVLHAVGNKFKLP